MKQFSIARLPLVVAIVVATVSGQSMAGDPGCPPAPSKGGLDFSLPCVVHDQIPEIEDKVHFESGSVDLSEAARETLDRQAAVLRRFPDLKIEVIGFADTREAPSSPEMAELGLKRAAAVREHLIGNGIKASRITAAGRDYAPIISARIDDETLALMRYVRTYITGR